MSTTWDGAWIVREHVFDPHGGVVGIVDQRREVRGGADEGERRVIQDNRPDAALAGHPLAAFAGHHEFSLVREGRRRRYLGPAVVGSALELDAGVMVSRGLWPALGWSFSGWSIVTGPGRQLTGGTFSQGGATLATIVGVAAPEHAAGPALDVAGAGRPFELARTWLGRRRRVSLDGAAMLIEPVARRYDDRGRCDRLADEAGDVWPGGERHVGPTVERELWIGASFAVTELEIYDAVAARLTCFAWRHRDGQLESIEVTRLYPEGAQP